MTVDRGTIWHHYLQTVTNFVSAAAAIAALIYSGIAYERTVRSDLEAQARNDWKSYLEMAAENPDISREFGIGVGRKDIDRRRYDWFVQRMLTYFNNILENSDKKIWRSMISKEISENSAAICVQTIPLKNDGFPKDEQFQNTLNMFPHYRFELVDMISNSLNCVVIDK
jgi:hypothetical protein